jgi:hypothetical protein
MIRLNCSWCTALTTIAAQLDMTYLNCSGCTALTTIVEQPVMLILDCSRCSILTMIAAQPRMINLMCNKCPLLWLPQKMKIKFNAKGTSMIVRLKMAQQKTRIKYRQKIVDTIHQAVSSIVPDLAWIITTYIL